MIPKKTHRSKDPSEYRPISLLSCLGKVAERLVKIRLYKFLESSEAFQKQQSGFREGRGALDNLLFFTQKISESFCKNRRACGIFFDISKPSIKFGIRAWFSNCTNLVLKIILSNMYQTF